ncbi:unnamed protein product [Prunus brigantina]
MSNCNLTPRTFLTSQTLKPFWSYSCLTSGDTIMVPYNTPSTRPKKRPQEAEEDEEPPQKIAKFSPFTGSARQLDGKPVLTQSIAPTVSSPPVLKKHQTESGNGTNKGSESSASASFQHSGKLVFGSNVNRPMNETPKVSPNNSSRQEPSDKEEEPELQAFTGKKYTLKW